MPPRPLNLGDLGVASIPAPSSSHHPHQGKVKGEAASEPNLYGPREGLCQASAVAATLAAPSGQCPQTGIWALTLPTWTLSHPALGWLRVRAGGWLRFLARVQKWGWSPSGWGVEDG